MPLVLTCTLLTVLLNHCRAIQGVWVTNADAVSTDEYLFDVVRECAAATTPDDSTCSVNSDGDCKAPLCGAQKDWSACQETPPNTGPASCPTGESLPVTSVAFQMLCNRILPFMGHLPSKWSNCRMCVGAFARGERTSCRSG